MLSTLCVHTRIAGKVQKKYKHVKKTLNASQGTDGPAERTKIRKPAGAIHGRDGFNLADFIEEHSGVGKEIYNAFMVRRFTCHSDVHADPPNTTDINPPSDDSGWDPSHSYLGCCLRRASFGGSRRRAHCSTPT